MAKRWNSITMQWEEDGSDASQSISAAEYYGSSSLYSAPSVNAGQKALDFVYGTVESVGRGLGNLWAGMAKIGWYALADTAKFAGGLADYVAWDQMTDSGWVTKEDVSWLRAAGSNFESWVDSFTQMPTEAQYDWFGNRVTARDVSFNQALEWAAVTATNVGVAGMFAPVKLAGLGSGAAATAARYGLGIWKGLIVPSILVVTPAGEVAGGIISSAASATRSVMDAAGIPSSLQFSEAGLQDIWWDLAFMGATKVATMPFKAIKFADKIGEWMASAMELNDKAIDTLNKFDEFIAGKWDELEPVHIEEPVITKQEEQSLSVLDYVREISDKAFNLIGQTKDRIINSWTTAEVGGKAADVASRIYAEADLKRALEDAMPVRPKTEAESKMDATFNKEKRPAIRFLERVEKLVSDSESARAEYEAKLAAQFGKIDDSKIQADVGKATWDATAAARAEKDMAQANEKADASKEANRMPEEEPVIPEKRPTELDAYFKEEGISSKEAQIAYERELRDFARRSAKEASKTDDGIASWLEELKRDPIDGAVKIAEDTAGSREVNESKRKSFMEQAEAFGRMIADAIKKVDETSKADGLGKAEKARIQKATLVQLSKAADDFFETHGMKKRKFSSIDAMKEWYDTGVKTKFAVGSRSTIPSGISRLLSSFSRQLSDVSRKLESAKSDAKKANENLAGLAQSMTSEIKFIVKKYEDALQKAKESFAGKKSELESALREAKSSRDAKIKKAKMDFEALAKQYKEEVANASKRRKAAEAAAERLTVDFRKNTLPMLSKRLKLLGEGERQAIKDLVKDAGITIKNPADMAIHAVTVAKAFARAQENLVKSQIKKMVDRIKKDAETYDQAKDGKGQRMTYRYLQLAGEIGQKYKLHQKELSLESLLLVHDSLKRLVEFGRKEMQELRDKQQADAKAVADSVKPGVTIGNLDRIIKSDEKPSLTKKVLDSLSRAAYLFRTAESLLFSLGGFDPNNAFYKTAFLDMRRKLSDSNMAARAIKAVTQIEYDRFIKKNAAKGIVIGNKDLGAFLLSLRSKVMEDGTIINIGRQELMDAKDVGVGGLSRIDAEASKWEGKEELVSHLWGKDGLGGIVGTLQKKTAATMANLNPGVAPLGKDAYYLPFKKRSAGDYGKYEIDADNEMAAKMMGEPEGWKGGSAHIHDSFLKAQWAKGKDFVMETAFSKLFESMVDNEVHFSSMAEHVGHVARVIRQLGYQSKLSKRVNSALNEWIDFVARNGKEPLSGNSTTDTVRSVVTGMRNLTYASALAFRGSSAAMQWTPMVFAEGLGLNPWKEAVNAGWAEGKRAFAISNELRSRYHEDVNLADSHAKFWAEWAKKSFDDYVKLGTWALRNVDLYAAKSIWLSAYKKMTGGKPPVEATYDKAAAANADLMVARAMGSSNVVDMPPISRSWIGKTVTTLMSTQIRMMNTMVDRFWEAGRTKETKALIKDLAFFAAYWVANQMSRVVAAYGKSALLSAVGVQQDSMALQDWEKIVAGIEDGDFGPLLNGVVTAAVFDQIPGMSTMRNIGKFGGTPFPVFDVMNDMVKKTYAGYEKWTGVWWTIYETAAWITQGSIATAPLGDMEPIFKANPWLLMPAALPFLKKAMTVEKKLKDEDKKRSDVITAPDARTGKLTEYALQ